VSVAQVCRSFASLLVCDGEAESLAEVDATVPRVQCVAFGADVILFPQALYGWTMRPERRMMSE
jgi:hypothetical protein